MDLRVVFEWAGWPDGLQVIASLGNVSVALVGLVILMYHHDRLMVKGSTRSEYIEDEDEDEKVEEHDKEAVITSHQQGTASLVTSHPSMNTRLGTDDAALIGVAGAYRMVPTSHPLIDKLIYIYLFATAAAAVRHLFQKSL